MIEKKEKKKKKKFFFFFFFFFFLKAIKFTESAPFLSGRSGYRKQ